MVDHEKRANDLWLAYLESVATKPGGAQFRVEADKWLEHISGCYGHWFNVLTGAEFESSGDLKSDLSSHYRRMRTYIESCDLEARHTQSHPDYGTWEWSALDMIHHSLTHGVYHRGHIRALAEARGLDEWPDTDWEVFTGRQILP